MDDTSNNSPVENTQPVAGVDPNLPVTPSEITDPIPTASANTPLSPKDVINTLLANKRKLAVVIISLLFALFVFTSATFAMIAYGKLPLGNTKFRIFAADTIMSLPFMPKSPEFVMRRSIRKSINIRKFAFDSSIAVDNAGSMVGLGSNNFDISVKGALDIVDNKNPQGFGKLMLARDLDLDLRVKDKKAYIKLNKFPQTILTMLSTFGLPQSIMDEVINKWFYFDSTPLDTEARKNQTMQKDDTDEKLKKVNDALIEAATDGTIKLKNTLSSDKLENDSVYKVTTIIDAKAITSTQQVISRALDEKEKPLDKAKIEKMEKSFSDTFSDIEVVSFIDKATYYLRKIAISFKIKEQSSSRSGLGSSIDMFAGPLALGSLDKEMPVSIVVVYSKIGEPVNVEIPKSSISFDELQRRIMEKLQTATPSGFIGGSLQKASNSKRRSDVNALLRAVNMYEAEYSSMNNMLSDEPQMISKQGVDLCSVLVPKYIASMPVDPNINIGRRIDVIDCESNYMTGYMINKSATGKITVSALYAENGEIISESR